MDLLFTLKKIIGYAIMPFTVSLILLFIAIITNKIKPRISFYSLVSSFFLLVITSVGPVSDQLMYKKERLYPAFTKQDGDIDYIIILGCAHTTDKELPATSQLETCSLQRLVEAIRIYNLHPEAQIITSGHAFSDSTSNAQMVKRAAVLLGIPEHKIITENFPMDTSEEAQLIAPRIAGHKSVLVTNANHMRRATKYFEQNGVTVIPAPASHMVKGRGSDRDWGYFVPSIYTLQQSTSWWYETVGEFVQWLKS